MDRTQTVGLVLAVAGVVGYVAGVSVAFPARAFAVTAAMVGITLLAVGGGWSAA